jgi:uncharacterized protein DUF4919
MLSGRIVVAIALASSVIAGTGCTSASRAGGTPLPGRFPSEATSPLPRPAGSYDSLVARLRNGDRGIDYLSLRLAYAETPQYDPYDFRTESRTAMRAAIAAGNYGKALVVAESILATNYVDIEAHLAAAESMHALGDPAKANYHGAIARGLVESIRTYASGRTPDSAIVVISILEEYMLLASQGLERKMQALTTCGGHPCDLLESVERASGKTRRLYFNVGIPYRSFGRAAGKDSTARTP